MTAAVAARPGQLALARWEADLGWRELRNRLAHEYPDAPDLRYAHLLSAIAAAKAMVTAWRAWSARLPST